MPNFKLLVVEDSQSDIEIVRDSIERYRIEKDKKIDFVETKSIVEALNAIDNSFDGALIDLRLTTGGSEGEEIFKRIREKFRIPVAIMTGTPADTDTKSDLYLGFYIKGETEYKVIFDEFYQVYDTGLTRILGGRGVIEDTLSKVFWGTLIPHLSSWKSYAKSGQVTEKALLRFTVSHLLELLDNESESCFPEEMYMTSSGIIKTGSIIKAKENNGYYIVLSPACDVALHKGEMKTDTILLCFIEDCDCDLINSAISSMKSENEKKQKWGDNILNNILCNNHSFYRHYLPKSSSFKGGIINFRKASSFDLDQFNKNFDKPSVQVAPSFVKDIVSRFSSYYARQGQPDFNVPMLKETLIKDREQK
jgi:CheY-like chemotaxis protein